VTAHWPDGQAAIQIAGVGQRVTLQGDTGHIRAGYGAQAPKPSGKCGRLV
jgi:hypothetical protein